MWLKNAPIRFRVMRVWIAGFDVNEPHSVSEIKAQEELHDGTKGINAFVHL